MLSVRPARHHKPDHKKHCTNFAGCLPGALCCFRAIVSRETHQTTARWCKQYSKFSDNV